MGTNSNIILIAKVCDLKSRQDSWFKNCFIKSWVILSIISIIFHEVIYDSYHLSNSGMLLKKDMELVVRFLQEQLVKDFGYKDDEVIDSLQECLAGKMMVSSHLRGKKLNLVIHRVSMLTTFEKLVGHII